MEPMTELDTVAPGIDIEEQEDKESSELVTKFTDWKNEPNCADLKRDLIAAQSHHDSHATSIDKWLDALFVRGSAKPAKKTGRSSVQPKLIRKQAEWRYASLSEPFLSTENLFTCSPVTFEDKKAAEQNQLILNTQVRRDLDRVKFIDEYVRAAVNEGTVILRTGWCYRDHVEIEQVPIYSYQPDASPEAAQMMGQIIQALQSNPEAAQQIPPELVQAAQFSVQTGQIVIPVQTGVEEVEKVVIDKNHPTVEVCNYNDVIIDPTCRGDLAKANFVIYKFLTSSSELKKTGLYQNLDYINPDATSPLAMADTSREIETGSFTFSDKPRKQFYAYEYWGYWDIHKNGSVEPIIATFVGDTLIRMALNPFPDKELPFVCVQYLPIKESCYGEPDGVLIEDNQKIIGAVTRGMIDIMGRSANSQIGIRKDALDAVNRRKFERGEDYEYNPSVDPRMGFYMHTYPEIPQSAQFMLNLQSMEAESLTGVKAFTGGLTGNALGATATGVRGVLDAASKRELGILRRLAEGITKIGRKFMSMNREWLSEEEVVRISNEEFVPINRDDLYGKIDIKLTITTAEEDNQKAQELAFMLQTVGASMPGDMTRMLLADIAKLRKMPDLAKRIEEYQPQPDPMQEQMRQLELMKAQMEIEVMKSEIQKNMIESGMKDSKRRNLDSDTDKKNLDYVEQETGTKHARDVDRITSQAKAQLEAALVEKVFDKGK